MMTDDERLFAMVGITLRAMLMILLITAISIAGVVVGFWLTGGFNNG